MRGAEVDRAVLCQHLGEFDNTYLAGVVQNCRERFTAVGLVDHRRPDALSVLEDLVDGGCFGGIRLPPAALRDNRALCCSVGALGLVPLVDPSDGIGEVLDIVGELATSAEGGPVVISHLGYPSVRDGRLEKGFEILELSDEPAVRIQLSGQAMFCDYPYEPLDDLLAEVIAAFGSRRVMWGSNFPVGGDDAAYRRDLTLVESGAWGFSPEDVKRVTCETARAVWFP
jgi:predicted TIM-barrel fold metal-dependent hydrolase